MKKLLLAVGLTLLPFSAMGADSTVSSMTAASALTGAELLYCVQGGADRKCTFTQAQTFNNTFPMTVAGTVTSGGIPYFSSTTALSSSALLAANALVIGGGAGASPATTTTGTGVVTAIGNAVNTSGGLVTASAASIVSGALLTGGGTGAAISAITPGTGVASALAANVAVAGDIQTGTSTTALVTPSALSGSAAFQTLTAGNPGSWNVASGYNAKLTLTANPQKLSNPTNVIPGITYIVVINPSTFGAGFTFDTAFDWGSSGAPTLVASKDNVISCLAMAASGANSLYCVANLGF